MNEREIEIAKLNLRIEILETAFAMLAFSAGRDAPLLEAVQRLSEEITRKHPHLAGRHMTTLAEALTIVREEPSAPGETSRP